MFSKLIKYFFVAGIDFDLNKYKEEFNELRIEKNINRCKTGGIVILILNAILILVDLFVYKSFRSETPAYLYLYNSHLIISGLILLWYAILQINKKSSNLIFKNILCYFFVLIILYWGVFMGLNSLSISGQISAYIICSLALSAGVYFAPLKAFLIYFSTLAAFIIGLCFIIANNRIFSSHIINAAVAILFSQVVSNLNYTSLAKDFVNKKKLEASNEKLKEYEKLRTEFFANISHELRTPLNVIYSAQQMLDVTLGKEPYYNEKVTRYIKTVKHNANRLIRLINNLIDITRIDAASFDVNLVNSNIIRVVEDITLSVADYVEHMGLTLTFDTDIEEKVIVCDPDLVERIVLNMLSNSVKFTEKGGSIFVKTYLQCDRLMISVKDNGIGIPKEMQNLVFDRFIQVDKSIKRKREGSGIGLALVKSLLEIQGGSIVVNSTLGEGSEFIASLPDRKLSQDEAMINPHTIVNAYAEKVNIEFSDIYD